jgi:hypothetical protein
VLRARDLMHLAVLENLAPELVCQAADELHHQA